MTPKEKAIELIDKHRTIIRKADVYNNLETIDEIDLAKQCALIAIDEIINSKHAWNKTKSNFVNYWQEVKQEIINL